MTTNRAANHATESNLSREMELRAAECGLQDAAFSPGSTIRFDYPAAGDQGARTPMQRRRLRVETIRALCWEPLAPITIELDPNLPRGSVLVTGHDLDKSAVRSFYLERMEQIETLSLWDEQDAEQASICEASSDAAPSSNCPLAPTIERVRSWTRQPLRLLAGIVAKSREEF